MRNHQANMAVEYIERALDSDSAMQAEEELELAIDELMSLGMSHMDWAAAIGFVTLAKANINQDMNESCDQLFRAKALLRKF